MRLPLPCLPCSEGNYQTVSVLSSMFTRGMLLFFLGSLLCTFSSSVSFLIAGRTIQGIGAAIYAPASLAMALLRFHKSHHALAIGIWAASVPIGSALSPTLASFILEVADWRWMFAVQTIGRIGCHRNSSP